MIARVAMIVCNTLLLFGLIEGAARIAERLHPDVSDLTFDYSPYRMLRMAKAPWALNREGFRAAELDTYRDTFLVEFLGGSVCLGVGTDTGPIVPERLQDELNRAGMPEARVLNLCQGGVTSAQELAIFLEYGLPLSPQVVVSFDGANDLMHPQPVGDDDAPNLPYRDSEMRAQFDGHHGVLAHLALERVITRLARREGIRPRAGQTVSAAAILNSYLYSSEVIRTLTQSQGGYYALLLQPTLHYEKPWSADESGMWRARRPSDGAEISRYVGALYAKTEVALGRWSAETGAPVFDLARVFADTPETVYSDSVHFSGPRGYQMLYDELAQQGFVDAVASRYRMWKTDRRSASERSSLWPH